MQIEILGAESLGVRSLCCVVKIRNRQIVIDPGIALGYQRSGLLPHPVQIAAGERIRERIIRALQDASDVVISHFHGDHIPLAEANPYQLNLQRVAELLQIPRVWLKPMLGESDRIGGRAESLRDVSKTQVVHCEGQKNGPLIFSKLMPHGARDSDMGTVMMTRVEDDNDVFVHASDIQLLDEESVLQILQWKPSVLLVSGPSVYRDLSLDELEQAWRHASALAKEIRTCIIDHHLLRCEEGVAWLDRLASETDGMIVCAADFMNQQRRFLEAWRPRLYDQIPVPPGWHESYAKGLEDTSTFRNLKFSPK